jgi:putative DNA methylase
MTSLIRKKLIEVSIPLEAINKASAKEKSIRHGHPSTLHIWWARRPLAACRAMLFAQLVDDPSAWPERFKGDAAQETERKRLHRVIEALVPWEASNNEAILTAARWEIARSVAWGLGEEPPGRGDGPGILAYLQAKAPTVYDPFAGGGSIPLEAQRLGLRAYGSDLNPVAVLIGKALVEIPPKFAGLPPINPVAQTEIIRSGGWHGRGAHGLAADIRYYGAWMRDEAVRRIGHLYPKAMLPDGSGAIVIAWLWARTVRSPDPAAKGAMVPLVSSFLLSTKEGKKAWVEPKLDVAAPDGYCFEVKSGALPKADEARLAQGTKTGRATFRCILTGATISGRYIDDEAQAGRMSARLMAFVAEAHRKRVFLGPTVVHEQSADAASLYVSEHFDAMKLPTQACRGTFASNAQGRRYNFNTYSDYFTSRQLLLLTTFSDLVAEAREMVLADAHVAGFIQDSASLQAGGAGAPSYADAIATYLALNASKMSMFHCTQSRWRAGESKTAPGFGRQAIVMSWDYAETNPFAGAGGDWLEVIQGGARAIEEHCAHSNIGRIASGDAKLMKERDVVISTDPPYYDNMVYADLSDFFYVWLRRSIATVWPDLFRRLLTPKDEELIATTHRHGTEENAAAFFMRGMGEALSTMNRLSIKGAPLAIYYAFKQSEVETSGITSAGWASFLQATVDAGLSIDGTWPIRTEMQTRMVGAGANALASSIVLVCLKRNAAAPFVTRAEFVRALRREMPEAIDKIRRAGVGPVDMQQSIIGPGMGVFTRFGKVLEDDDSAMGVRTALTLINRVWEEIENELDAAFDPATQVARAWFATYGFDAKPSGELITLANAKNIPLEALFSSGVFQNLHGRAGLIPRTELPVGWTPVTDKQPTVWECVQHTARVLAASDGGAEAAAALVGQMGRMAADARTLAYRLFEIATKKSWAAEALVYNELAEEWPHLEDLAPSAASGDSAVAQADMFQELR